MSTLHPVILLSLWMFGGASSSLAPQAAVARAASLTRQNGTPERATHGTRGVARSITPTALVITRRAGDTRTDTSVVIRATTLHSGVVASGSTVENRYRIGGRQKIATAVSVEETKS